MNEDTLALIQIAGRLEEVCERLESVLGEGDV